MGEVFSEVKQEMGVPQGSVLSDMPFNIKINNIVKNINCGTNCALNVDDFLICHRERNIKDNFKYALISSTNGPLRMD